MKNKFENWTGRPLNKDYVADVIRVVTPPIMYLVVYLYWFFYIENYKFAHYTVIHTVVDDYIPFVEAFIIPYYMWFFYVVGVLAIMLLALDLSDFYKCFIFLATGMTLFLIISTLWPNMQNLRPAVMPRDNIFTHMVLAIYKTDTPTNLWPSIHVYNSIGIMIAIHNSPRFNKVARIVGHIIGLLIILSTMFVKQHSVYDVTTAFIMAIIFYLLFYKTAFVEEFSKKREEKLAYHVN